MVRRAIPPNVLLSAKWGILFLCLVFVGSSSAYAQVVFQQRGNVLEIIGTSGNDDIQFDIVNGQYWFRIGYPSNSPIRTFPINNIKRVRVYLGAGNDGFVYVNGPGHVDPVTNPHPSQPSLELYGGPGNDTLRGSQWNDLLDGGDGKDTINGYGGSDILIGGGGDDYMLAGSGDDFLCGDAGNDYLRGEQGYDWVFGGGEANDNIAPSGNEKIFREPCSRAATSVVGDWDGNGVPDAGLFLADRGLCITPGRRLPSGEARSFAQFGAVGDIPVVGDWDGNGTKEMGVFRAGIFLLDMGAPGWGPDHVNEWPGVPFGFPTGDLHVIGDWNGDKIDDVGVFRKGWLYLDVGPRGWGNHGPWELGIQFGLEGDLPIAGDWDGNGQDEVGVFRKGRFYLDQGPVGYGPHGTLESTGFPFGVAGDQPVAGNWDHDAPDEVGVIRGKQLLIDEGAVGYQGTTYGENPGFPLP